MKPVTIYTTPFCGYCISAKRLLGDNGVAFDEIDVAREPARRAEMVQRAMGRRTVPQIFIGETHLGGFQELYALDRTGKLGPMIRED